MPGEFIPDEWLSPHSPEDGFRENRIIDLDIEHYLARTSSDPWIDDHHPAMLSRGGTETTPPSNDKKSKFRIQDLAREGWEQKNAEMVTYISAHSKKLDNCEGQKNLARFFGIRVNGLKHIFKVRSGRKRSKCCDASKQDGESQTAQHLPFTSHVKAIVLTLSTRYL